MLKSLYWKFALAFMLVAVTTAGLVALFVRLTSADRLMQFIIEQQRSRLGQALSIYYSMNGSWSGVEENWQQIQSLVLPTPASSLPGHPPQDNRSPE